MLERMSLKAKLALVALVPVVVMLCFGVHGAWQKFSDYQHQKQAQSLVNLVVSIGEVVHELQKERGISAGFIGSKGSRFSNELISQRKLSDEKVLALKQAVSQIEPASVGPRYIKLLENTEKRLSDLTGKRERISQHSLDTGESFRFYSDLIAYVLEVTARTGNQMPSSKLSRLSNSKQALLFLKERNGQERALLTGVFSSGRMSPGQFNSFLELLGDQATFLRLTVSYSTSEQEKLLLEKLADSAVKEVSQIEQMVKEKASSGEFSYSPETWFSKITAKIDLLRSVEERFSADILNELHSNMAEVHKALLIYLSVLSVSLLLTVWLCVQIVRNLMGTLGGEPLHAAEVLDAIANGDLNRPIRLAKGDTSSLLACVARMQDHLREMITEVHQASRQVTEAASSLSATARQVEAGAVQGSESAMSIAAAIEEMTAAVKHISANADGVNGTTRETAQISIEGHDIVSVAVREMQELAEVVSRSTEAVGALAQQSEHIAEIVNVIKEISDQTNLLALNAAIEAARAGEQGRGFAVVADEVRKLAERTGDSTVEISRTLDSIRLCMNSVLENMNSSNQKVSSGVAEAERAGDSMDKIRVSAEHVMQSIDEISTALREKSCASAVISSQVDTIAAQSEETAIAVKTVAQTSAQMESLAQKLTMAVSRFHL